MLPAPEVYLVFSSDGKQIAIGDKDSELVVWNIETGQRAAKSPRPVHRVSCLMFSADGNMLISGSDNKITVWEFDRKRKRVTCPAGSGHASKREIKSSGKE